MKKDIARTSKYSKDWTNKQVRQVMCFPPVEGDEMILSSRVYPTGEGTGEMLAGAGEAERVERSTGGVREVVRLMGSLWKRDRRNAE